MHCHLHHPLELLLWPQYNVVGHLVKVAEISLITAVVLLHFQVSPVVQMSADTWSLSFAKYLELRFYGRMYRRRGQDGTLCPHSLHHDHYQYFGMGNIIASFRYISTGNTQMSTTESSQVSSRSFCFQLPAYQLAYKLIDMIIIRNDFFFMGVCRNWCCH